MRYYSGDRFDIVIDARTDFVLTLTVRDNDGNLMDLTGCTVAGQLREYAESPDHFDFTITHNNTGGKILVKMPHGLTEKIGYTKGVYDIILTDTSDQKECIIYGDADIVCAVTR